MERRKIKLSVVAVALMIGLASGARAQGGPCDGDIDKYCGDVQPGQGQLENCIHTQQANFTHECRDWLKNMDRALKRIGSACSESARAYCRDVRPGYGRVVVCLKNNWDKLPVACQHALEEK